jgi:hypothetical protein
MNVEIGTEAAQFTEKKDIHWIFVAVQAKSGLIEKVFIKGRVADIFS